MDQLISVKAFNYDILHKTGIPYNPQGQAIVEWAHRTLKDYIHKTKKGEYNTPWAILSNVLYILDFLTFESHTQTSAAQRHWQLRGSTHLIAQWKDVLTGAWKGPDPVLTWVWKCVCVSTEY